MTATNRCLYYDSINPLQSLNVATGVEGQDFVADWNTSTSGRGVGSSYYEGNIKTCADKGMRLPTHYETVFNKPTSLLPIGDLTANGGPLSSDPAWAGTSGVPSTVNIWTASARLAGSSGNGPRTYIAGPVSGSQDVYTLTTQNSVRCVLPDNGIPACTGGCYQEGTAPNYAQDFPIGTERQGPSGSTLTLQFANGSSGFKIWKEKGGTRILNSSGIAANGWQKQLTRAGRAFTSTDFTTGSNISGRVCPSNVFIGTSLMTATGRCLYYDGGNPDQSVERDTGTRWEDNLWSWGSGGSAVPFESS
jgi:hypothetical protein